MIRKGNARRWYRETAIVVEQYMEIVRILLPVGIHYLVLQSTAVLMNMAGLREDPALCTTITAVLVLPLFLHMMKKERRLPEQKKKAKGLLVILAAGSGVAANLGFSFAMNLLLKNQAVTVSAKEVADLLESTLPLQILGLGIAVPISEELLFRGLVYQRIKDYNKILWNRKIGFGIFAGALIFALYHGSLLQILFAFPMGILLIVLYEKSETILAPVVFHMAVNLSSILLNILERL